MPKFKKLKHYSQLSLDNSFKHKKQEIFNILKQHQKSIYFSSQKDRFFTLDIIIKRLYEGSIGTYLRLKSIYQ
ncbi:MAG: hypothetical protein DRP68_02720 [Candidatus Omnitrophota bacterium]|nr:MAG: hypothetical protein DRP68_02720 [Candidatus Omnitrophota bacterium]